MSLQRSNRGQMFNKWIRFVVGGGSFEWPQITTRLHVGTTRLNKASKEPSYLVHNVTIQGGRTKGVWSSGRGWNEACAGATSACLQVMSEHCVVLRSSRNPEDHQIGAARWMHGVCGRPGAGVTGCFKAILEKRFYTTMLFSWYVLAVTQLQLKRCPLSCEMEILANLRELSIEVN